MTLIEMIADNFNVHPKHINKYKVLNNIEVENLGLWMKCANKYGVGKMQLHLAEREARVNTLYLHLMISG